jgi:endonuclease/exonuclease/phosphatase family metal-dependent hydrolase
MLPEYSTLLFLPAMEFEDGSLGGSAILARAPVSAVDHLALTLLPDLEDNQQRAVLHARFDLPGGSLHIFNAHFSWVAEQARLNIEETLPYLERFEGQAILVGDLNTPSGSSLLRRFSEAGWRDIWAALRPDEDGYTFESGDPSLRIDYAWANPLLQSQVRDIEIVANILGTSSARPSDHYGLLVSLAI